MALTAMMKIKANEIAAVVNAIPVPLRDTLMKYVYKGFESPKDYPSNHLLVWHEKVNRNEFRFHRILTIFLIF